MEAAMVELVNNFDSLEFIITKAREYDVQVPNVDENSGSNATDDGEVDILDENDNPTAKELVGAIRALNDEARTELLALMWVGRGDFSAVEWKDALAAARERYKGREARYLLGTPLLGDYLEEGLDVLEIDIEPYDIE